MIVLDDASTAPTTADLDAAGGFTWWYLEVGDGHGGGVVFIWGYGLPFLPGYADAIRRGRARPARERPFLNVAAYARGQQTAYVLHELHPDDARWDGAGTWQFGHTRIQHRTDASGRRLVARVALDCPVRGAGGRIRGELAVEGPVVRRAAPFGWSCPGEAPALAPHRWTPLAGPATGRAAIELDTGRRVAVRGPAYHDRNVSPRGLQPLGIASWLWTRASPARAGGGERIAYALWPDGATGAGAPRSAAGARVVGFDLRPDGAISPRTDLALQFDRPHRTLYGVRSFRKATFTDATGETWLSSTLDARVDLGPFYLRYLTAAGTPEGSSHGSAELIAPRRVDLTRHRWLVRMRVGSDVRRNAFWLPLFDGAARPLGARLRALLNPGRRPGPFRLAPSRASTPAPAVSEPEAMGKTAT